MVWACAVATRRFAFCAELKVRFVKPARPGEELHVSGELLANRRNRVYEAKAKLKNPAGELLAVATGKYRPIRDADAAGLMTDFVGDPEWFLRLNPGS